MSSQFPPISTNGSKNCCHTGGSLCMSFIFFPTFCLNSADELSSRFTLYSQYGRTMATTIANLWTLTWSKWHTRNCWWILCTPPSTHTMAWSWKTHWRNGPRVDCMYSVHSTATYLHSLSINFRVGFMMEVDKTMTMMSLVVYSLILMMMACWTSDYRYLLPPIILYESVVFCQEYSTVWGNWYRYGMGMI